MRYECVVWRELHGIQHADPRAEQDLAVVHCFLAASDGVHVLDVCGAQIEGGGKGQAISLVDVLLDDLR